MAASGTSSTRGEERDWHRKESPWSALAQILLVAAILIVGVYFYVQRGKHRKDIAEKMNESRLTALKDNPADLEHAYSLLVGVLSSDPRLSDATALSADIQVERWLTHRVTGAEAKARELLASAEGSSTRSEDRYANHALILIADGKAPQAIQYSEDLRSKGASSGKLWYALAEAYEASGQEALAKQAYQQATDKSWKSPRYFAAYAERLIERGEDDQAVEVANKGLAANPDHYRSKLARGLARVHRGLQVIDAQDALRDAESHDADLTPGLHARALTLKAELAAFQEHYADALAAANEALSVDPNWDLALWAKARALALMKDPGAVDAFKAAAKARPSAAAIPLDGARLLTHSGDAGGALTLLDGYAAYFQTVGVTTSDGKAATALDRDDRYWVIRGQTLQVAGKGDEAMAAFDHAISMGGLDVGQAFYAKGALLLSRKDYDGAMETLKRVTPEDGTGHLPEAYVALGEALFAKNDYPTGCQNYAYALARMRALQAPRDRMNAILDDVTKRLVAGGQKEMSKAWVKEAKPIIQ